jgi:hypothetical protein
MNKLKINFGGNKNDETGMGNFKRKLNQPDSEL